MKILLTPSGTFSQKIGKGNSLGRSKLKVLNRIAKIGYKDYQYLSEIEISFCNLFIFPRTDLYIHDSIYTMFQYTKVTM